MVLNSPLIGYIAAASMIVGVGAGWKVRDWQCDAAYAAALQKAEKQRQQMQGKIDAISSSYEEERNKADVVVAGTTRTIREIYRTVPDVPADCAPDARVIGLLQGGVDNANASASSKSGK
jgi:hypothetical protein